jgi:ISXO2-like transposase domain
MQPLLWKNVDPWYSGQMHCENLPEGNFFNAQLFFSISRLTPQDTMLLGYLWLCGSSHTSMMAFTGHSSATIVAYSGYLRQLVSESLDSSDTQIGGEGVIVEVDESKFGKRKNNRGHQISGAWVIGGIERTPERKFFGVVVEKRDSDTIVNVLSRFVLAGSIVHTDCWRGYTNIEEELGVVHLTVNHSLYYVDPQTGVHTSTIEAKWAALKRKITLRGRVKERLGLQLLEQIWRRRHESAPWAGFISALRTTGYN